MGIKRVQDFDVWQFAHQAVLKTYRLTQSFPPDERFGLIQQMRRAAVSIPANISEGFGRRAPRDKVRFYNISQASLEELRYYYILSHDLGFLRDCKEIHKLLDSTARMLKNLVRSIVGVAPIHPGPDV